MTDINRHGNEENDGIDGISFLPDDIRTHILSFLTTKEAVQTCILSKRWIKTWASIPDLKFDIKEFGLSESFDEHMAVVTKLELLMKSVLAKREASCVNRFRLCLDSRIYWPHTQAVVNCIGDVMKLGPRECLVRIDSYEKMNLNTGLLFTCESLIHLQLFLSSSADDYFVPIEPNSVNLLCLKTLSLVGITMSDDSFKKLLLGCPVLEDLLLDDCYIDIIEICSKTLKKLVLHICYDVMRFQISTPNLLYLDIFVVPNYGLLGTRDILLLNVLLLVHASIYIHDWCDEDIYITRGPKLIHSLSNVESLQLEFGYREGTVHKKDFSSCPVFNNLKRLELVNYGFHVFELESYFLHHSPKLHELTLTNRRGLVTEFVDEEITQEGPRDALVQREFLKTVRIAGFKNDNGFVDHLINKLLTHVKIIGDIVIDPLGFYDFDF